jgi:hypothetical protein
MFAGGIGFGRPYSPIAMSFIGLGSVLLAGKKFPGLTEWVEKLFLILSLN